MDIFTKNVYTTAGNTYKHLKTSITDPDLVAVSGDNELWVIIKYKINYHNKWQEMTAYEMGFIK